MSGEPYAGCEESMMGKEQEDIFYTTSESKFALDEETVSPVSEEGLMEQDAGKTGTSEVDELLKGEEFLVLRKALARKGICTLDQLRALKLWSFMNYYALYSIGTRQKVLEDAPENRTDLRP